MDHRGSSRSRRQPSTMKWWVIYPKRYQRFYLSGACYIYISIIMYIYIYILYGCRCGEYCPKMEWLVMAIAASPLLDGLQTNSVFKIMSSVIPEIATCFLQLIPGSVPRAIESWLEPGSIRSFQAWAEIQGETGQPCHRNHRTVAILPMDWVWFLWYSHCKYPFSRLCPHYYWFYLHDCWLYRLYIGYIGYICY